MSLYAFIANFASSVISSALPVLVTAFATFHPMGPPTGIVPFDSLVHLIAVNVLMLGAANIFWVPLSNTFGRRPILIICIAMLCGFSIWCAEAKSFHSLLAARVLQGVGGAAADTLSPDVIGRVFFVHQRGRAMAIYTIFLASGSLVGGLAGGYITAHVGWRWTMWISAIVAGALFLLTVFFLPETLFDREAAMAVVNNDASDTGSEKNQVKTRESMEHIVYPPYTFGRSLGS